MITLLPLTRDTEPGLHQVCASAGTDYPIAVPEGALAVVIAFVTSDTDDTPVWGRVAFDQTGDVITITDTNMGHQPPMPVRYRLHGSAAGGETYAARDEYLHVASATAGAVCLGMWLFAYDTGE